MESGRGVIVGYSRAAEFELPPKPSYFTRRTQLHHRAAGGAGRALRIAGVLVVLGHEVGCRWVMGGWPASALWRR